MFTFLIFSLLILPIFNAESFQNDFENNDELLMQRSAAASYLFGVPMRRYPNRLLDLSNHNDQPQRAKRIYWENLAFHATDYNQKPKKV